MKRVVGGGEISITPLSKEEKERYVENGTTTKGKCRQKGGKLIGGGRVLGNATTTLLFIGSGKRPKETPRKCAASLEYNL